MTGRQLVATFACLTALASTSRLAVAEEATTPASDRATSAPASPTDLTPVANQNGMEQMMASAKPGPEHAALQDLVGKFATTTSWWMAPNTPPMTATGKSVNTWVLGGRYIEQKFTGTFMDAPFEGIGYTGYDNVTKQYVGSWMDTLGTGISTSTGQAAGNGELDFDVMMPDPMRGGMVPVKEKIFVKSHDSFTMEMWDHAPDGSLVKIMEIVFVRMKK
jgi:hypothetical protein